MFELVLSCFGACHCLIAMRRISTCVVLYMQCRMQLQVQQVHAIMLHATCNLRIHAFSHDIECTSALCKFCKFCSVFFVPLLFALHCFACAVFALLVDKAGVLCNCKFCSCNKANMFADAKCNYSPGTPTYLVILHFLARKSGLAPLRTVHSLVLLAAPWVPCLQLHCCIQRYSACLPAILVPNRSAIFFQLI